jgi:predicted secreted protein
MRGLALLTLLLLGLARAGDAASLEFWGFSGDGRHLAFEQYGVQDGSGFPYAELYIVEVARNTLLHSVKATVQSGSTSAEAARRQVWAQSRIALSQYGIVRGKQGRFAQIAGKNSSTQTVEFTALGRGHRLELATPEAPKGQAGCLTQPSRLLELRLDGKALQRDARLPASRACAYDYEIHSVFVLGSSLAVFVKVTADGFEGPNLRWMVVSARLG